jgi:hypothetical protein
MSLAMSSLGTLIEPSGPTRNLPERKSHRFLSQDNQKIELHLLFDFVSLNRFGTLVKVGV